MQTTKEILIAAKALIEKPSNWTQDTNALNDRGEDVEPDDPGATCFCSYGAIVAASSRLPYPADDESVKAEINAVATLINLINSSIWSECATYGAESVTAFNDRSSHPVIMKLFDAAIICAAENEDSHIGVGI